MATLKIDLVVDDHGKLVLTGFGQEVDRVMWSARGSVASFGKQLAIGAAALSAFAAIGGVVASAFIGIADTYTLIEGRLKLVTNGTEQLNRVQEALYRTSLNTHQGMENTADLYTGLARSTKDLGIGEERLLAITANLNKAFVVSGASQQASGDGMRQLTQAMYGGTVRAEEFNSILENTPRVLQAVHEGLGISMGQLRQEMLDGKLSAERFLEGFEKGAAGINAEFDQLPVTVKMAMGDLKTVWDSIIDGANDSSGATAEISEAILTFARTIDENRAGIISLFTTMINLASSTAGALANIGQSFRGWAAVGEGRLGFFEFATMNAKDLAQWLERDGAGLVEIELRLEKLAEKRRDIAESFAFTSEARKAKQTELAAIDKQIAALRAEQAAAENVARVIAGNYTDSWQKAGKAAEASTATTKKNNDIILDQYEKYDAALAKYFKTLDDITTKEAARTAQINAQAAATERHIWALNGIQNASKAVEDSWMTLIRLAKDYDTTVAKVDQELHKFFDDIGDQTKKSGEDFKELQQTIEGWGRESADAFVEFCLTGKSSFSDMIRSMIADLMKMIAYQQFFKPLFTGASGFFADLLGAGAASAPPGKADGGAVSAGGFYEVNERGPELLNIGNRLFLMMGSRSGVVEPNRGISSASSLAINVPVSVEGNRRLAGDLQRSIEQTVVATLRRHV